MKKNVLPKRPLVHVNQFTILLTAVMLVLSAVMLSPLQFAHAEQQTFIVNTLEDQDGECNEDGCSLREAILAANDNEGPDRIEFDEKKFTTDIDTEALDVGNAPHVIDLDRELPGIEGPVSIKGITVNGKPIIRIEGDSSSNGLVVSANGGGTTIQSLIITGFNVGVLIEDASDNTVIGNWLLDNDTSILIRGEHASGNRITKNRLGIDDSNHEDQYDQGNGKGLLVEDGPTDTRVIDNVIAFNNDYGILLRGYYGDDVNINFRANDNCIVFNEQGFINETDLEVDGNNNWWGTAKGPTPTDQDYDPEVDGDTVSFQHVLVEYHREVPLSICQQLSKEKPPVTPTPDIIDWIEDLCGCNLPTWAENLIRGLACVVIIIGMIIFGSRFRKRFQRDRSEGSTEKSDS